MNADFLRGTAKLQARGQRLGQAVWNTAADLYPDLVEDLRGSAWDPFYADDRVSAFLALLAERLEE